MTYGIKDLRKCVVNHSRICKLYSEGTTIGEIMRLTGYGRNTIKNHLRKAGIYKTPEQIKQEQYNNNYKGKAPSADNSDFTEGGNICQEVGQKKFENGEETEEIGEFGRNGIEILEADTFKSGKGATAPDFDISIDKAQIKDIDKVINHVLKLLKDKDRLKKAKTSVLGTIFSIMVEKKKILQGLDPKSNERNQFIINFFANREFLTEIKKMKQLKEKQLNNGDSM